MAIINGRAEEENELLDVVANLVKASDAISPDETGITDMHHSKQERALLLHFNGKAFAITCERF